MGLVKFVQFSPEDRISFCVLGGEQQAVVVFVGDVHVAPPWSQAYSDDPTTNVRYSERSSNPLLAAPAAAYEFVNLRS